MKKKVSTSNPDIPLPRRSIKITYGGISYPRTKQYLQHRLSGCPGRFPVIAASGNLRPFPENKSGTVMPRIPIFLLHMEPSCGL